jgi:hypothetical protein
MSEAYDGREVVGMDLHRSRSVLVRMTADGRKLPSAGIPRAAANRPPGPAPASPQEGWPSSPSHIKPARQHPAGLTPSTLSRAADLVMITLTRWWQPWSNRLKADQPARSGCGRYPARRAADSRKPGLAWQSGSPRRSASGQC